MISEQGRSRRVRCFIARSRTALAILPRFALYTISNIIKTCPAFLSQTLSMNYLLMKMIMERFVIERCVSAWLNINMRRSGFLFKVCGTHKVDVETVHMLSNLVRSQIRNRSHRPSCCVSVKHLIVTRPDNRAPKFYIKACCRSCRRGASVAEH